MNAPVDDVPFSEEEERAVAEAKAHAAAGGRWFSGEDVSEAIRNGTLADLLRRP